MIPLYDQIARTEKAIEAALTQTTQLVVAWSSGKDSDALLNITLALYVRRRAQGRPVPPLTVLTADTGIDNPVIQQHLRRELDKITAFGQLHGITELDVQIAQPSLAKSWVFRRVAQGDVPPFPGMDRQCAIDLKREPSAQALRAITGRRRGDAPPPVVLIGSRFAESADRARRMEDRGSGLEPRDGDDGLRYCAPLAHWETVQVWQYLQEINHGTLPGYSDFEEVFRVYQDAAGSSCTLTADRVTGGGKNRACGSRFGCSFCLVSETDRSLEAMITGDPASYGFLEGIAALRNWLARSRYDWNLRTWLPRKVAEDGTAVLRPEAYSSWTRIQLLRYLLTLDADERAAAQRLDIEPRFRFVDDQTLIAIDADWARRGVGTAHLALRIDRAIEQGHRYFPPVLPDTIGRQPRPRALQMNLGKNWQAEAAGLRDEVLETYGEGCPAGATRNLPGTASDGPKTVMNVETAEMFSVDPEAAGFIRTDWVDLLPPDPQQTLYGAFMDYMRLGSVQLTRQQVRATDRLLRQSSALAAVGLNPDLYPGSPAWEALVDTGKIGTAAAAAAAAA